MQKQIVKSAFVLIVLNLLTASFAFAHDEDIPYGIRIPYRIIRGITNIGLGWTEIILRPIGEFQTESIGTSLGNAATHTFGRTAFGFEDIFMSWVPDMNMQELYPDWNVWPYLFHWT